MVIMAESSGNVVAFNGVYIPTKGLMTDYLVDEGSASAAITEYVNSLKDFAVVQGVSITDIEKAICNTDNKTYLAYKANVSGYNDSAEYIAYDVFVDGVSGEGICVSVTSSFENESVVTQDEVEESYIFKMATVNDKFNWNDDTLELAKDPISIEDIDAGYASPYITEVKKSVDSAYNYFNKAFGWKGLSGDDESFLVYINPGDYVEEDLPTEKAMYTNNQLMFFREDLTQGDIDYNTVMHEYAHGVMHNLVGFHGTRGYSENSAIAEGLADVFAELAEATKGGIAPDWLHGARNLYAPSEEYFIFIPEEVAIKSVDDCYKYSTIVSHTAAEIAQIMPSVSAQNEFWFKAMCLMTSSTDFSELSSILNAVATNMHEEKTIDDTSFDGIISVISSLDEGKKETEIA